MSRNGNTQIGNRNRISNNQHCVRGRLVREENLIRKHHIMHTSYYILAFLGGYGLFQKSCLLSEENSDLERPIFAQTPGFTIILRAVHTMRHVAWDCHSGV